MDFLLFLLFRLPIQREAFISECRSHIELPIKVPLRFITGGYFVQLIRSSYCLLKFTKKNREEVVKK